MTAEENGLLYGVVLLLGIICRAALVGVYVVLAFWIYDVAGPQVAGAVAILLFLSEINSYRIGRLNNRLERLTTYMLPNHR